MTDSSAIGQSFDLDLLSVLSVFREAPARVLASGHPSRRVMKALRNAILGDEDTLATNWGAGDRVTLLYHLARSLGFVRRDAGHLRVDGAAADEYFLADSAERMRRRVRAYRGLVGWSELRALPGVLLDDGPRARANGAPDGGRVARARALVLDQAGTVPSEEWIPVARIDDELAAAAPALLFPAETGPYYPGVENRSGSVARLSRSGGWPYVEGAFIRSVLAWLEDLGALESGEKDGETVFRLGPTGVYALGVGAKPPVDASAGGELVVQPTFEVVVLAERADVSLVLQLERFATRTGPGPGTTYRIEEATVYRAVREGMEISVILEFLAEHAKGPVPTNVAYALSDWSRRQDRIQVHRRAALIEFDDAMELDAQIDSMDLEGAGARIVGDRWIILADGDRRSITRCLGQNFFAELDYSMELPPCVEVLPDLTARVVADKARLDVDWQLSRFTEADEDGTVRITEASLAKATEAGLSAEQIAELMEAMVVGGAPPEVRVLADAVGGLMGPVAMGSATILVADRPEDLERILSLRAVEAQVLRPLGRTAVAIAPGAEAEVRSALAALGVAEDPALLQGTGETSQPAPAVGVAMESAEVRSVLRRAVDEGREAVIRYDPGARQPLQDVRVVPERIETKNGVPYLHARQVGRQSTRKFSLRFVSSARLLS
jgi:hypothetical protein